MSKQQTTHIQDCGIVSVLYRLDDQPLIPIDTADLSNIKETLSFHQYYCPFNTSIPLCEFDKTDQIVDHLDKRVGADLGQDEVLVSPPRRIKAQDILLTTYKRPQSRRTCFFLLPRLGQEDYKQAVKTCQASTSVALFPRPVADRFHAVTFKGEVDGYDIVPDLLDTSYRPDN